MKKLFALLVALLVFSFSTFSFAEDSIVIPEQETLPDGDYRYVVQDDGTAEIFRYFGTAEELVIPETLNGIKVVGTQDGAYFFDDSLTHVTIPETLTRIGANPFAECGSLNGFTVSVGHPTLETTDGALFSKPDQRLICYPRALTAESWNIPEGTRFIGDGAFSGCEALTCVVIPDSVTVIGNRAFCVCSSLSSIALPDGVTDIGYAAFSGCLSLASITIPDSVKSIGHGAFRSCEALAAIAIPEGITVIEDRTFAVCMSLTEMILPDSITSIGNYAFDSCSALTDVIIPDSVTSIGKDAFAGCDSLTVTVSSGSYAEQYCMENGVRYKYPDETNAASDYTVSAGDIFEFGNYEQDNHPDNGPEPIEWIVLDVQDGKALLLSRYGLEVQPYNTEFTDVTWETCTLRSWLNNEFLNAAFSAEEQSAIPVTIVDNSDAQGRSDYDTSGGNDTEDQVFLLSLAEADRYLEDRAGARAVAVPTAYAAAMGAETYTDGTASGWLTRSPGYEQDYVATYGSPYYGCSVDDETVAVRPAVWVNLESGIF